MAQQKKSTLFLAIVVIAVAIIWLVVKNNSSPASSGTTGAKNSTGYSLTKSGYQAVILTNDQAYIGKVDNLNDTFVRVNDAYRLVVSESSEKGKTDLKLVKLEEGVHGPTNTLLVNRNQISLVEDLRADSKLLDIIKNYKPKNK